MGGKDALKIGLGQRVKWSRENLNLSRKAFAEIIDISEYFLVQVELGKRGVSNVTLCKMSEALPTNRKGRNVRYFVNYFPAGKS